MARVYSASNAETLDVVIAATESPTSRMISDQTTLFPEGASSEQCSIASGPTAIQASGLVHKRELMGHIALIGGIVGLAINTAVSS